MYIATLSAEAESVGGTPNTYPFARVTLKFGDAEIISWDTQDDWYALTQDRDQHHALEHFVAGKLRELFGAQP